MKSRVSPAAARAAVALLLLLPVTPFSASLSLARAEDSKAKSQSAAVEPLSLDRLFPRKNFLGKSARGTEWSPDDRYVAFLWNPYEEKGYDLYLYDTKEGKTRRLTTLETFLPFDRDLYAIRDRYAKEKVVREQRKKLSEAERFRLDEEDAKKEEEERAKRKEPVKEYGGIGDFRWANKKNELLINYRGDLYRMSVVGDKVAPVRLTKTREPEGDARFTPDDAGFTFRRGDSIYRARFDSPLVEQLNPELPNNMSLQGYYLSPDGSKMVITSSRRVGPPPRQVSYLTYRDRFAEAKTTTREAGDDPVRQESYVFGYDLADDDPVKKPNFDGKPWEVFKRPEGEAGDISFHQEPFSPDGKRFVFASWKRDKKELQVHVADFATKKAKVVYKGTSEGEHRSPSMADPFFSPDGSKVAALLEQSGFRHAYLIDPTLESATQVTRGEFEVYPLRFTPDGKSLLVRSSKEDPSRADLYRVSLPDGAMERVTKQTGTYGDPELSHDARKVATSFNSWASLPELYVLAGDKETKVTDSHSSDAPERVSRLKPQRFSFKNRHGQNVHGVLMLPPNWQKTEQRPLLIYVYGGPLGTGKQVQDGSNGGDYRFNIFASESLGYITAIIDPRGSSGYGAAFGKANYEAPGVAQVEDLTDGVNYLKQEFNVDPKKVGVRGWSFGGFQTQMCLYTAPDVFTLGIAGAGPTEWQNYNNWYVGGVIGANKKADDLDKYSLTKLAKNLKSPLMLLHGLEDTNVLAQDTIKVYRELLKTGKGPLVELVLDPTGGHGLGGDINAQDRFRIYAGFLERHWGRYTPPAASSGTQQAKK
ncbi:MAG TPA: prolyl oligopeptidase family serine peptidase [Armatimonadaceae bacterium]|nr:prolyl oligopeptidase family serine peptidase [Armatimonadaceae bacterium]